MPHDDTISATFKSVAETFSKIFQPSERITIRYHTMDSEGRLTPESISFSRPLNVDFYKVLQEVIDMHKATKNGETRKLDSINFFEGKQQTIRFDTPFEANMLENRDLITHIQCDACGFVSSYEDAKDNPNDKHGMDVCCPKCMSSDTCDLTTVEAIVALREFNDEVAANEL